MQMRTFLKGVHLFEFFHELQVSVETYIFRIQQHAYVVILEM